MIGRLDIACQVRSRVLQILPDGAEQLSALLGFPSEGDRNRVRALVVLGRWEKLGTHR